MCLQLRSAVFLLQTCWLLVWASLPTEHQKEHQQYQQRIIPKSSNQGIPIISDVARTARIAEFVSSHKILEDVHSKNFRLFGRSNEENHDSTSMEPENFGITSMIYENEQSNRRNLTIYPAHGHYNRQKNELISGVRISYENPTTILPILTTQRDILPFDFVPVNIVQEDAKGNPFLSFDNKNFEDLGDVPLVPAGSNTRIQVKKGPNGKEYEYEYVYYYYDEEDEGKAGGSGATASNSHEASIRTQAPVSTRMRGNSNRHKYNTVDRTTTTIEPIINEVIPNRVRQLESGYEEITEERLPTNTRFPPRTRINHAVETTEGTSRGRNNRQRATIETVDSSSFRSQLDGPEFPQNLPNGPVRFLGVTPNEDNEEMAPATIAYRGRGRPQRVQEPAPVQENYDEPVSFLRKKPIANSYDERDLLRQQGFIGKEEVYGTAMSSKSTSTPDDSYTESVIETTEAPTTQGPHAMDKVALDLYAFLQQGRSNLVDFVKEVDETMDSTVFNDPPTTDLPYSSPVESTTLLAGQIEDDSFTFSVVSNAPTTTSSTTSTPAISNTTSLPPFTSSEEPSTISGRGKFRRPGLTGHAVSRNRYKSSAGVNSSTEVPSTSESSSSSTQRSRGRFGGAGLSTSFKRSRPLVQKHQPVPEQPVQKESVEPVPTEIKQANSRGRFRGPSARSGNQTRTTVSPLNKTITGSEKPPPSLPQAASIHRPPALNKIASINRRRGSRPGPPISASDQDSTEGEQLTLTSNPVQEQRSTEKQPKPLTKLPAGIRAKLPLNKAGILLKPGMARLNLRPRAGHNLSTSPPEATAGDGATTSDATVEEPASEATEEETREAPPESSPAARITTANPLNKLRNRNRIQVHPKMTTVRTPLPPAARRSPLLPRRKTTEVAPTAEPDATISNSSSSNSISADNQTEDSDSTEAQLPIESSTIASNKHEESRSLSSLLAPRRRIVSRRPGQPMTPTPAAE